MQFLGTGIENETIYYYRLNGFLGLYIAEEFSRNSWLVTGINRMLVSQKAECNQKTHISYIQSDVPSIRFDEILLSQQPDILIHAAVTIIRFGFN